MFFRGTNQSLYMDGYFLLLIVLSINVTPLNAVLGKNADFIGMTNMQKQWRTDTGYVDRIIFKVISDVNDQIIALKNGEIDIIGNEIPINETFLQEIEANPVLEYNVTSARAFAALHFNCAKFPTNMRTIRQSFAWALNKNRIQQLIWYGLGIVVDSPLLPSLSNWSIDSPTANLSKYGLVAPPTYYAANPQEGNLTLLEEGFYDIDSDGYRDFFNGTLYPLNLRSAFAAANISENVAANAHGSEILEQLPNIPANITNLDLWVKNVSVINVGITSTEDFLIFKEIFNTFASLGIRVQLDYFTLGTFLAKLRDGEYNSVFLSLMHLKPNLDILTYFTEDCSSSLSLWRWCNSTYNDLINIILTSSNVSAVEEAAYKAQLILWNEQPLVVLYNYPIVSFYRVDKLEGWVTTRGEGTFTFWSWLKVHPKGEKKVGGTLIQSIDSTPWSLNPWMGWGHPFLTLLYPPLWVRSPYTLDYIGWLADSLSFGTIVTKTLPFKHDVNYKRIVLANDTVLVNYTPVTDTMLTVKVQEISFTLHPNLYLYNHQQPLTADDVKYSFELIRKTQSPALFDILVDSGNGFIDPDWIETPTNLTVKIYSLSHSIFAIEDTYIPIVSRNVWERIPNPKDYENYRSASFGPYILASGGENFQGPFVFIRNPNWPFSPKSEQTTLPKSSKILWRFNYSFLAIVFLAMQVRLLKKLRKNSRSASKK